MCRTSYLVVKCILNQFLLLKLDSLICLLSSRQPENEEKSSSRLKMATNNRDNEQLHTCGLSDKADSHFINYKLDLTQVSTLRLTQRV
jgi:hypothetical protein